MLKILKKTLFSYAMSTTSIGEKSKLLIIKILFTQPLRSGRIWHKVNIQSGV